MIRKALITKKPDGIAFQDIIVLEVQKVLGVLEVLVSGKFGFRKSAGSAV